MKGLNMEQMWPFLDVLLCDTAAVASVPIGNYCENHDMSREEFYYYKPEHSAAYKANTF